MTGMIITSAIAQPLSLIVLRSEFSRSVKEEGPCKALYEKMNRDPETGNAVWVAYHGVVTISMARFTVNPVRRYHYFKEGKKLIEKSVAMEPLNVEVRFLRLSVQDHTPSFLGYNDSIESDKKYILEQLSRIPQPGLKKSIIRYIERSDRFTEQEKKLALGAGT
jgi:hypothetical protein